MSAASTIILVLAIGLFVLFGVLIKYFKFYWLISGYNTASEEKKKNVDIVGLGNFLGNFCFILAGIILLAIVLDYLGFFLGFIITLGALFPVMAYMLLKAQKYDYNTQTKEGKTRKSIVFLIIALMLFVFIVVGGMIYFGSLEQGIVIRPDKVKIEGMYGMEILSQDIMEITLQESLPSIIQKSNGFDFGEILKGRYELENLGETTLFICKREGPFIFIRTEKEYIIINFKNAEKTEGIYTLLKASWETDL